MLAPFVWVLDCRLVENATLCVADLTVRLLPRDLISPVGFVLLNEL